MWGIGMLIAPMLGPTLGDHAAPARMSGAPSFNLIRGRDSQLPITLSNSRRRCSPITSFANPEREGGHLHARLRLPEASQARRRRNRCALGERVEQRDPLSR